MVKVQRFLRRHGVSQQMGFSWITNGWVVFHAMLVKWAAFCGLTFFSLSVRPWTHHYYGLIKRSNKIHYNNIIIKLNPILTFFHNIRITTSTLQVSDPTHPRLVTLLIFFPYYFGKLPNQTAPNCFPLSSYLEIDVALITDNLVTSISYYSISCSERQQQKEITQGMIWVCIYRSWG